MERLATKIFTDGTIGLIDPSDIHEINWCEEDGKNKDSTYGGKAIELLAAYQDTGLMPDEIPHWIPVSENLPEYDELLQRYSDSTMELISVLACGYLYDDSKLSAAEVNRMLIKKSGIKQIDEQYTGKWEWSNCFKRFFIGNRFPCRRKEKNHESGRNQGKRAGSNAMG